MVFARRFFGVVVLLRVSHHRHPFVFLLRAEKSDDFLSRIFFVRNGTTMHIFIGYTPLSTSSSSTTFVRHVVVRVSFQLYYESLLFLLSLALLAALLLFFEDDQTR